MSLDSVVLLPSMLFAPEKGLNEPALPSEVVNNADGKSVTVKQASDVDLQFVELINLAVNCLKVDGSKTDKNKIVDLIVSYIPATEKHIVSALQDHDKLATLNLTECTAEHLVQLIDSLAKQIGEQVEDNKKITKALQPILEEIFRRDMQGLVETTDLLCVHRALIMCMWQRMFKENSSTSVVWGSETKQNDCISMTALVFLSLSPNQKPILEP